MSDDQTLLDKLRDAVERLRHVDGLPALATLEEAVAEIARLRALIDDFVDEDDCWFDHHGYCQAHGWMVTDPPCPHSRAKALDGKEDGDG